MRLDVPAAIPVTPPVTVLEDPGSVFVDLRSPAEFSQDHVPGAVNVPLFDDVERAVIGTLYRQRSPEEAFDEGVRRSRAGIGRLVRGIASAATWSAPKMGLEEVLDELTARGIERLERELVPVHGAAPSPAPVVLYCWRGGLRSRSVVALVRALGLERAVALEGGYKGYRAHVRRRIAAWTAPVGFVLRGLTGVGKTLVLREIERLRPGWTLDLEELAGHRSSVLGMVGLEPCTQKTFETRLVERLERGFPDLCVLEGESRKVGDVVLPGPVWDAVHEGVAIELTASSERRVDVLIDDYLEREENRSVLARQLPFLEERLGPRWGGRLVELLEERRDRELVAILLEHYYDPAYRRSEKGRAYAASVDSGDPTRAARDVVAWIEASRRGRPLPVSGIGTILVGSKTPQ